MRILILGVYYSNNLGDAVICDCVAARLAHHYPEAEICIRDIKGRLDFEPHCDLDLARIDYYRKRAALRHFVTKYTPWDKEKSHALQLLSGAAAYMDDLCSQDWSLVIFAGGQLFQDGLSLFLEAYVRRFDQRGIPVLFNACGTGPSWSPYVRQKLREALSYPCVRLISTRDNAPLIRDGYLKGKGKPVVSVSDPALWSGQVYGTVPRNSQTIGLGIMYATSVNMARKSAFWLELVSFLEKQQVRWQFFINGDDRDLAYARHIIAQLPPDLRSRPDLLAPPPVTPRELMETVGAYRGIISFRLHSHVIAAALGIPGVAIYWDEKLPFFYKKLGHPERCKTIRNTPAEIWNTLQSARNDTAGLIVCQREESEAILLNALRCALEGAAYDQPQN